MSRDVTQEEIRAFLDGALPDARAAEIEAALNEDAALAARLEALPKARDPFNAAIAAAAAGPLPRAWLDRVEAAVPTPIATAGSAPWHGGSRGAAMAARTGSHSRARRGPTPWRSWAMAASLALAVLGGMAWRAGRPAPDAILQEAAAAYHQQRAAVASLQVAALTPPQDQAAFLQKATGLALRAPDLRHLGWRLATLRAFSGAAELRYQNAAGEVLSVYVRRSNGTPRFDMLRDGHQRVCIWQDDVVGTVITADLAAGPMMRVASAAYAELNL